MRPPEFDFIFAYLFDFSLIAGKANYTLILSSEQHELVVFKSRRGGITTATIKALTCFCLFGLWPKIQATRYAGGR
jgi:hypothetical protein